jgi:hypothetical protein
MEGALSGLICALLLRVNGQSARIGARDFVLVNKPACLQLSRQVSGHDFSRAVTGSYTAVILSDSEGA